MFVGDTVTVLSVKTEYVYTRILFYKWIISHSKIAQFEINTSRFCMYELR